MALLVRLWSAPTLLLALAAIFWSANSVVGRAVHPVIHPAALSFWRWTVAAVLMGFLSRRQLLLEREVLRRHWRLIGLAAVFGVGLFGLILYVALGYTTAVNALLMQAALPAVTMLMMLAVYREVPPRTMLIGSAVAMLGVVTIVCRGSAGELARLSLNPGDLLTLLATLLYAFYSVVVARGPRVNPLAFASVTFAFAAAALLPVWIGELILLPALPVSGEAIAAILFVAVFPSCLAYLCYNRAIAIAGPSAAGNVTLLMPLFGSLMAVLFLGERLALYHLAGGALIVAGILVGRRRRAPRA